tara:strand:- start:23 stop:205 length:183 start_codon:yes stop_codon:yes gene_type:complete
LFSGGKFCVFDVFRGPHSTHSAYLLLTENLIHGFTPEIEDMLELAFNPERVDEVADWAKG